MNEDPILHVKQTAPDWWELFHHLGEFKMKYERGTGDQKIYSLFENSDLGFCYKETCTGASPGEAFSNLYREKHGVFSVTIKSIF